MKKIRILLLCAVLVLCAILLCSCGKEQQTTAVTTTTNNGQSSGDQSTTTNKWADVDFGTSIRLQLSEYSDSEFDSGAKKYMQGPDGPSSDKVQNLVYMRNSDACGELGLTVEYYYINMGWSLAAGEIILTEQGDSKPDMYCDMIYDMMKVTLQGCFRNLYTMTTADANNDGVQDGYFDISEDNGYLTNFMNGLTFSSDKKYLIGSQYYLDLIRAMMVMPLNIDMYDSKCDDIDQFYQDVIDGKWTWDYLMKASEQVYNDKTGNGNSMDDTLGFAAETLGGKAASGIVYSTDLEIVKVEEKTGLYTFTYNPNNSVLYTLYNKIAQVFASDGVSVASPLGSTQDQVAEIRDAFAAGQLLFGGCIMMGAVEAETYQEMEQQFGLVPIPKLDEKYNYNTLIHNVGRCGAISLSTTKPQAISAYIQYCSENSADVVNEYYNYAMKYKYTSDAGTAEMLDQIYNNVVSSREKSLDDLISATNADAKLYNWHSMLISDNRDYKSNADQIATVYETAIRIKQTVIGKLLNDWKKLS